MTDKFTPGMLSGKFENATQNALDSAAKESYSPSYLALDTSRYMSELDELEMSEAQKVEFLKALWSIMTGFADLGFGVDSVIPTLVQNASKSDADALKQSIPTHEFNVAVDDGAPGP